LSFVSPRSDEEEEEEEKVVFAPAANASPSVKAQSCPSLVRLLYESHSRSRERERESKRTRRRKNEFEAGAETNSRSQSVQKEAFGRGDYSADTFPQSFAFLTNIFFPKNPLTERELTVHARRGS